MFEKIGLHIINGHNRPLGCAPVVVLVNVDPAYYHQVRQEIGSAGFIAVRWTDWNDHVDPRLSFLAHVDAMRQMAHPRTVFIGYNEPVVRPETVSNFYSYEEKRAQLLHDAGLNVAWFTPSVGEFNETVWVHLASLLKELRPNDVVSLHEYWTDAADVYNPWHHCRWQKIPCLKDLPILVTEYGRDFIPDANLPRYRWGASGWKKGGVSREAYLNEIASANDLLMGYPNVLGAALFTVGNDKRWADYDVADVYERVRDNRTAWPLPSVPLAPMVSVTVPLPGTRISQRFGENPTYYKQYGLAGHNGVDFATPAGFPVREFHNTVVMSVSGGKAIVTSSGGYGVYVYIQDTNCDWLYAHLSEALVKNGEVVKPGQAIGIVGYSGNTIPAGIGGTHLHWGKRPKPYQMNNGYSGYVDPLK